MEKSILYFPEENGEVVSRVSIEIKIKLIAGFLPITVSVTIIILVSFPSRQNHLYVCLVTCTFD